MAKDKLSYLKRHEVAKLQQMSIVDYTLTIRRIKKEILRNKEYMRAYLEIAHGQKSWNNIEYCVKCAKEAHTTLRRYQQKLSFIRVLNNKFHLGKH